MAACAQMETRCEALEKEFPTCGSADVCLEEKDQCQAKCRVAAMVCPTPKASRRRSSTSIRHPEAAAKAALEG